MILDVGGTQRDRDRPRPHRQSPAASISSKRASRRLTLVEDRFLNLADVCDAQGRARSTALCMDVGVSSMQLDQAGRGFSFRLDGPLDMRMGRDGPTAADVIAKASETDLANVIYHLRRGAQIARHRARRGRARGARRRSPPHGRWPISSAAWFGPSPTTFIPPPGRSRRCASWSTRNSTNCSRRWCLRNGCCRPGGRLAVVSFHSLEDRIVKNFLQCARQERRRIAASARGRAACAEFRDRSPGARWWPTTPKSPPIPARARPSCGRLHAPQAPAHRGRRVVGLPSLHSILRGGLKRAHCPSLRDLCAGVRCGLCLSRSRWNPRCAPRTCWKLRADDPRASAMRSRPCVRSGRRLQTPSRLQGLAQRHLALQPIQAPRNTIRLKNLPARPPSFARSTTPIRSAP